jgi:hypothetical protein
MRATLWGSYGKGERKSSGGHNWVTLQCCNGHGEKEKETPLPARAAAR